MTKFCHVEVPVGAVTLTVDGNSKITARGGTYAAPSPNAFSLPAVSTCPGSTAACRECCYVQGLEKNAPIVAAAYKRNEAAIHDILRNSVSHNTAYLFGRWIAGHCEDFRWHVSGDVFSEPYAWWIVSVCKTAPDTRFWIYTRSLWAVSILGHAPNLAVNVSADRDNYHAAMRTANAFGVRVCYLARDPDPRKLPVLPAGSVIFPDYPQRGRELSAPTSHAWWQGLTDEQRVMVCPTDFFGQSEAHRCGPCTKCLDP